MPQDDSISELLTEIEKLADDLHMKLDPDTMKEQIIKDFARRTSKNANRLRVFFEMD